jgi:L-ribulose-5-phosphate 4-epimerase
VRQIQELKEQVALANRLLHHYGLATYQGHLSARIPGADRMLIKGRPNVSMDRIRAQDLMSLALDGDIVEASPEFPTRVSEWALHAEIYRARPEVGSVVHTHQKWCTIFGIAGKAVLPMQHPSEAAVAAEAWPVYQETYGSLREVEQARVVARLLGGHVACHLRTHGMVFVGANIERALSAAADAEHQAELTWRAMLIGTPEALPMVFMRGDVERRYTLEETAWDRRDGAARDDWGNLVWLDEHLAAGRERSVQL